MLPVAYEQHLNLIECEYKDTITHLTDQTSAATKTNPYSQFNLQYILYNYSKTT